jgi:hypothetical protein
MSRRELKRRMTLLARTSRNLTDWTTDTLHCGHKLLQASSLAKCKEKWGMLSSSYEIFSYREAHALTFCFLLEARIGCSEQSERYCYGLLLLLLRKSVSGFRVSSVATFFSRTRLVLGVNLCSNTGYAHWSFRGFPQSPRQTCFSSSIRPWYLSSKSFSIHQSANNSAP